MTKVDIICDNCNKKFNIKYNYPSELFNIRCPECKSNNTWIGDITEQEDNEEVTLGKGGCSQK